MIVSSNPQRLKEPNPSGTSCFDSILRFGNIFELDFTIDALTVQRELAAFESSWVQYNPDKPNNPRFGLSITSLDGGLSGYPDLHSLREVAVKHGHRYEESDFREFTPVYYACPSIHPLIRHFHPHIGRTHFLRMKTGGYFPPHRDGALMDEPSCFRILVPLNGCNRNNFIFIYNEERFVLESGGVYFINTMVAHSLFSFSDIMMMVCNIPLNRETTALMKKALMQR